MQDWSLYPSWLPFKKPLNQNMSSYCTTYRALLWVKLQVRMMYLNQPFLEERPHVSNSYFSLGRRRTASSLTVSLLHVSKACIVCLKLPRQLVLSQKTLLPKNILLLQPQWPPPAWRCSWKQPPQLKSALRPGSASCHSKLILRPSCNPLTPPRFTPLLYAGIKLILNT